MAAPPTPGHDDVEGIDVERVGKWFTENIAGIEPPFAMSSSPGAGRT